MFIAALLARYQGARIAAPGPLGLIRDAIEPAPELTEIIRGVPVDFRSKGEKASPMRSGPVALAWKHMAV